MSEYDAYLPFEKWTVKDHEASNMETFWALFAWTWHAWYVNVGWKL